MRALTEFALREALALLLDDPTPHNVALAATGEAPEASQSMESQMDEMSEDSESQAARQEMLAARETQPRVVMVRYTNASTKTITLVDRSHSMDAFVPDGVMAALKDKYGYQTLSRLRGSVLRVEKYHFSTPAMCYREEKTRDPQETKSAATPRMDRAKICLFVEQLSVVDDNELAVNPLPHLEEHEAIASIVSKLSQSVLEQRIMLRQGRALPVATDNDEIHPLLEEDVAIPEEEERAMDAQEGWDDDDEEGDGLSDSQLIEENGPVSDSLPEIPDPSTRRSSLSQRMSQLWNAVRWVVVPTTEEPEATEEVLESQDAYHFQQDNIEQAFVEYEDTESEGGSDNEEEPLPKSADKEGESEAGEEEEHREIDTQTTETQFDMMYETENGPLTQAPDETSQSETPPQPRDLPVGKPNTQLSSEDGTEDSQARVDASQLHTSVSQPNDSQYELGEAADQHWHTQADDDSQMMIPEPQSNAQDELAQTEDESAADEDVADDDHVEVELHVGGQNDDEQSDKSAANVPASARAESNRSEESLRDQSDAERASFRQKRKRALVPESYQKRQCQDQDVESPERSQRSGKRARSSGASSKATFGLSSWKKKPANVQQQRPARQYQHLLPPFRLDSIMSMIANKE